MKYLVSVIFCFTKLISIRSSETLSYLVVVRFDTDLGVRTSRQSLLTLRASQTWSVPVLSERSYLFG